jgi:hypothetical protein
MRLVQLAVKSLVLFAAFIVTANAWSATVRVEAIVGEAVVVFEDIDCPETVYSVPTGEVARTNPVTCEAIIALSTVPDDVGKVVWLIANADPDDQAAIEEALADLSVSELAMVVTVLQNNQQHLGTDDATVVDTIASIVAVNPEAAETVVLTATVLNPSAAEAIVAAAVAAAPEKASSIQDAADRATDISQEFKDNQSTPSGDSAGEDGEGGESDSEDVESDPDVEVVSITETEPEAEPARPPESAPPPVDTTTPPGGAIDTGEPPSPE